MKEGTKNALAIIFANATAVALGITMVQAWKDLGEWLANKVIERKTRKKEEKGK